MHFLQKRMLLLGLKRCGVTHVKEQNLNATDVGSRYVLYVNMGK